MQVFRKILLKDGVTFTTESNNKWFLTKQNKIVAMINATYFETKIYLYGQSPKYATNYFETPIQSSNYHGDMIVFPLIHTLEI